MLAKVKDHVYRLEVGTKKRIEVHLENLKIIPEAIISHDLVPDTRQPFRSLPSKKSSGSPPQPAAYRSDSDEEAVESQDNLDKNQVASRASEI